MPQRGELQHIEKMIEVKQEQLETKERRVIEAENDVARERRRIEILDEKLDEPLETLDD